MRNSEHSDDEDEEEDEKTKWFTQFQTMNTNDDVQFKHGVEKSHGKDVKVIKNAHTIKKMDAIVD